ncbi:hypothetical protein YC2023_095295 [Brassica napus]
MLATKPTGATAASILFRYVACFEWMEEISVWLCVKHWSFSTEAEKKKTPDEERRLLSRRSEGESRDDRRLFPRRTTAICLRRLNKMANPHEPHFFKPLLPGFHSGVVRTSLSLFTIPLAFFSKHIEGKTNQKTWKLRSDASDETWEVIQEGRRLTRGWKDFTTAHDLQIGDLVIFKHEGDMVFHVTPFGPSCCEIQYTHPHIIKEEADAGDVDDNEISKSQ